MEGVNDELRRLRDENQRLLRALDEAEDLAGAIRTQRVDAFVIETPLGQRVFAIDGANRPYRALIEEMHQGALTLGEGGLILFCNRRFASMLGVRPEKIIATRLCEHLVAADQDVCDTLMRKAMSASAHGEMRLRSHSGVEVPVYVSLERLAPESGADLGAVVTDLSEQIAHKQVVAAEDLARSILEQALDAMIVCNPAGLVLRCNQSARDLCGRNPLHERFDVVFPLRCVGRNGQIPFQAALDAPQLGIKAKFERPDGTIADLLLNAGPLRGPDAEVIGVVITLNDLSEHQRLLASEQAARAEAERANRLKDEFVATLSHELRTPLNAMLNWTHILRLNANLDPQIAEGLDVILRNGRTQAQLIADLFDTSRMLSGTLRFELQEIDAREVIEAAIKSVQPSIEQKRLRLSRSLAADAGTIAGDPARLQQVVWNLLTNAIKFTPPEGRIDVSLARDGAELVMRVQDTGRGIAPEFLAFVFDRFRQADASVSRKAGGLGLGLAITKQIVELHGGTIEASSAGIDRGATFCVRLPIRSMARADTHPGGKLDSAAKAPPSLAPTAFSGLRVLVVDDALDAREIVKRIMEDCGAHIVTASSVDDAVRALQQFVPDLVISDIGMPDRDGYELIHLLRSLEAERGGNAPAIALTAYARHEDRLQALRAGYNAHIAKPIDIAKLMATVASLVPR